MNAALVVMLVADSPRLRRARVRDQRARVRGDRCSSAGPCSPAACATTPSSASRARRRCGPPPTSACASPRSCTTSSATPSASSPCRPASGMHLIDSDPAEAKQALEHISRTSRSSLAEIRRLLGLVRSGEGADAYAPTPGLSDLARLADEVTDAGLAVDLTVVARRRATCRPASSWPPTASCRRRSPTPASTPGPSGRRCSSTSTAGVLQVVVTDDGTGAERRRPAAAATAWSACRSGSPSTAARSTSVPADDGGYPGDGHPALRRGGRPRDPRRGGRRPGPGAQRLHRAAQLGRRHRGGGRGQRRRRGGRPSPSHERPDVILMDIRMPGTDGLEATRRITADERLADTRVLILTTFDLDEYVFEALRAGASGFLLKDTLPDDLLAAVRVVAGGQALLAPSVTRRLMEEFVTPPRGRARRAPARPRHAHRAGDRGAGRRGPRPVQHRDRRHAVHVAGHGQDPREPPAHQAPRPRPAQLVMLAYEAGVVAPGQ